MRKAIVVLLGGLAFTGVSADATTIVGTVQQSGNSSDPARSPVETFGNESFWNDAMCMPKGILDAKVTPIQALKAGLMIDIELSRRTCRRHWRRS
jgi:hypothetical protein